MTVSVPHWQIKPLNKGVYSERREFAPRGANVFPLRVDNSEKKGIINGNGRVTSPEIILFLDILRNWHWIRAPI